MGRIIVLAAIAAAIWWWLRSQSRPKPSIQKNNKPANKSTVRCTQCNTYIPNDTALRIGEHAFCDQQHLQQWQEKQ